MNNKLVFDDSYIFHTNIYFDVFNVMKNVLNRARTGTCATTGTFTLFSDYCINCIPQSCSKP